MTQAFLMRTVKTDQNDTQPHCCFFLCHSLYLVVLGIEYLDIEILNAYKPRVFFVGHRQTVQTQTRHRPLFAYRMLY